MNGPFHAGEREMQRRAGVLEEAQATGRIIARRLPRAAGPFLARQRLAVATSLDARGRVWVSLLTGPAGFVDPVDSQLLRLATQPAPGDPMAANLDTRPELGLLVLDPATRQRMRFNGRGLRTSDGVFLLVHQVYGNCPKYIQKRRLEDDAATGVGRLPRVSTGLDERQRAAVACADTFFIGSFHPESGADASHRGGRPGFVRVLDAGRLAFDDYPGNGMFNTLGNLVAQPRAGLLFLDFETGDVLQMTGEAHVGDDFAVVFRVDEVRETLGQCPLRYRLVEPSPSNPPLSRNVGSGISSTEPEDERQ